MTQAELAYQEALDRIKEAGEKQLFDLDLRNPYLDRLPPETANLTALEILDLDDAQVSDLTHIANLTALIHLYLENTQVSDLAHIANLTALEFLSLTNTQVSDLAHIANLTALKTLYLTNTKVSDLRPVLNCKKMTNAGPLEGLYFEGSLATQVDPELDRLSNIEDDHERTQQTFAYLETLPPYPDPLPWEKEIEPAAVPKLTLTEDHRIDVIYDVPDDNHDEVARDSYEELQEEIPNLQRFTNQYYELEPLYRKLCDLTQCEYGQHRVVKLHITLSKLAKISKGNANRKLAEQFPQECLDVIDSIISVGTPVTMGTQQVKIYNERQKLALQDGIEKTTLEHEQTVLDGLLKQPELTTDRAKDEITELSQDISDPDVYRSGFLRNSFLLLGQIVQKIKDALFKQAATAAAKFIYANTAAFIALARDWGEAALIWAQSVVRQVVDILGQLF